MVVERVDARGRDDPCLPHRAAEQVLEATGARHRLLRSGEERAERAAEPLREAERHRVEAPADRRRLLPAPDGGVEQPSAVEVEAEVELVADRAQLVELGERPDPPAGRVVRVLDPDDPRARRVDRGYVGGGANLLGREAAGDARQAARDDARVDGRAAELGDEDVAVLLAEQLVARLGVEPKRDLVRHRRRRQEDRRRLAEKRSAACLELVHGRIFALLLVPDSRGGNRGAHPGGGPRCGVGAEVDHAAILRRRERAAARGELVLSSTQALPGRRYPGSMDLALLEGVLAERGEPAYRSRQVWEWAARGVAGYEEMTNVPASLRELLAAEVPFSSLTLADEAHSSDGTIKALFRTDDGHPVEAVLMRYRDGRRSICVSSQSGCPLTCTFCATGAMKFGRNLTPGEILDQALHFRRIEPVDHLVFMGMGEPMLNLDNVLAAARRLPDVGITHRRTTISTVGWLPGLTRFIDEVEQPIRLALSLHAADPRLRSQTHARQRPLSPSMPSSPSAAATSSCATGRSTSST